MTGLVFYLSVFVGLGVFFLLIHLLIGKLVRPARPVEDKLTIYECGEPTVGSAWIQFDLRYYVVALLFVIFDVEVAFFFPWAVVFGKANELADPGLDPARRQAVGAQLVPARLPPIAPATAETPAHPDPEKEAAREAAAARQLSWLALVDILVFFGVLLVGFAYLWRRGDIDWVRSVSAERPAPAPPSAAPEPAGALAGVGPGL
jgi:NADH-quinone oxidoreductase subunit A